MQQLHPKYIFMKIVSLLLFMSLNIFAANIDDYAKEMDFLRDYDTALTKAKQEDKVLVMVLGADYCPWCRKFERNTLSSQLIKPKLNNDFITLVVDKKYDIDTFPTKFRTNYTPMVFFINPKDESILEDTVGYMKKKEFLVALENAEKLYRELK